jgi:branched-chain amino acid transport system substrate-binding protein
MAKAVDRRSRSIARIFLISFSLLQGIQAFAQKAELRIGFIAPLSGDLSDIGASTREGAELAMEQVNAGGGLVIGGRAYTAVLLIRDGQSRPEIAVNAAQELINREHVSAIIGPPISGTAIPVARLAEKSRVPMITQVATVPEVTRGMRYVFRVCYTDDFQGKVLARFVRERLSAATAAVLYDVAGAYNKTVAEIFIAEFRGAGGRIVAEETYTTGTQDFRSHLLRIQSHSPDVLFLPNYAADLRIQLDQIRELTIQAQIVGTDTMSFRDAANIAKSEGAYFSTHFSPEIPEAAVQDFARMYQRTFNRTVTVGGALTYDAFGLLFDALKRAGKIDPEAVAEALRSTLRYEGVTGVMEFAGSPDPKKSVVILRVQNGLSRFFARIDP